MSKNAVLVGMGVAAIAWALAQQARLNIVPPASAVDASPDVLSPPSRATVELRFAIEGLQETLNARAPKNFSGRIEDPTDALVDDYISWNLSLGELTLQGTGSGLRFEVPVTGGASLEGRVGAKKKNKGLLGELEETLSVPFSESVVLGGFVSGHMRPVFLPDWTIDPQLSADLALSKAEADLFGKAIKVSFRDAIKDEVNAEVRKFIADVNQRIASDATLRREAEKGWGVLHQVVQVNDSPPVSVVLRPADVGADDPVTTEQEVILRIAASVHTAVRIGSREPLPGIPKELPSLGPVPYGVSEFQFAIPVVIHLESLQALTPGQLGLPEAFETPVGIVRIRHLSLLGRGAQVQVTADIEVSSDSDSRIDGIVSITGKPVLDQERDVFRVEDLRVDVESSSKIFEGAGFLLEPALLAELGKRTVFDMRALGEQVAAAGDAEILAMTKTLPEGIELDANITRVGASTLVIHDSWLIVIAEATGDLSVRVNQL